ncbi:MAG: protein kinase [Thermoanaerobaculia bacterium]
MTPERWQRINDLYLEAVEHNAEARAVFLDKACDGDPSLRNEVASLVASHDQAGSFIAEPALQVAARVLADDRTASWVGRTLSHYRIESLLGVGGMGEVYLAEDTKLDRRVALKVVNETLSQHEASLERFVQEAKAASALNHPNILVIHEIGVTEEANYIVSEFVEGRTLREVITESPMKLRDVLDISIQVASALRSAHEANLVHRDIKPENIIIRPDGYLKILDFGLAKLIERSNESILGSDESAGSQDQSAKGTILGTVSYMSPEQARGDRVDERTDIFSLGVVIQEMLTGRTPFAGDSVSDRLANLINAEPPPLSHSVTGLPDELQRIISKTLRKNRDERHQAMALLLKELKSLRENLEFDERAKDEEKERSVGRQQRLWAMVRRHQPLIAFALVAALIGAIGLGSYFVPSRNAIVEADGSPSIAVLPLRPVDSESRDELYEMGIADSLILTLSSMKGLVVRPLSATRRYTDVKQDPIDAGREQKVDYILASNYQLENGRIRVTAQLFHVASGRIEETYKGDKNVANVFAMQDSIAGEVGRILAAKFTISGSPAVRRGTSNEEAYRSYLQGMYLYDKRTVADSRKAVEYLDESVRLDPEYARAWAGKAHAHRAVANRSRSVDIHAEYQKSMEAINRSLALNENLSDAHSALCENRMFYEWDFDGAERECTRALELDPDSSLAHQTYSRYLDSQGRHDEAIAEIQTAIDLDPASLFNQLNYGISLYYARRYPEAVVQFRRLVAMNPNFDIAYPWLSQSLEMQGKTAEAFEWWMNFLALQEMDEGSVQRFRTSFQTSGWSGFLREQARTFEKSDIVYFHVASLNARLGNKDKAFELLEKSSQRREFWITRINVDPALDSLHGDPRFDALVRRVGLARK